MVLAGALIDPLDGGILVFKDCTKEVRARCERPSRLRRTRVMC